MKCFLTFALVALCTLNGTAAAEKTKQDTLHLFRVSGVQMQFEQFLGRLYDQLLGEFEPFFRATALATGDMNQATEMRDSLRRLCRARARIDELMELMAPVYERHLGEEDIQKLIEFYESPLGKRFVEKMPQIISESQAVGMEYGERAGKEITAEMEKVFSKEKQPQ